MASTFSFFDTASPFVVYATSATHEILVSLLRSVAATSRAILDETIRIYFDSKNLTETTIGFKLLLNKYSCTSCDKYLFIHQQITNTKLQKSDLDEDKI